MFIYQMILPNKETNSAIPEQKSGSREPVLNPCVYVQLSPFSCTIFEFYSKSSCANFFFSYKTINLLSKDVRGNYFLDTQYVNV